MKFALYFKVKGQFKFHFNHKRLQKNNTTSFLKIAFKFYQLISELFRKENHFMITSFIV